MRSSILLSAVALITSAIPVHATLIVYSDKDGSANSTDARPNSNAAAASFDAAAGLLGPMSLLTFESATLGSFHNYQVATGVTINGTSSGSADQTIRNSPAGTPDRLYGYNTTSSGSRFLGVDGGNVVFSFSPAIQSFGAYISGVQFAGQTITFSDGSSQTVSIPNPSAFGGIAFVGFTDQGKQISAVTITAQVGTDGDIVGVDDVRFGVPEPATMTMACLALLLLIGGRRLLRSQSSAA